ncbi:MAG: T9SS type A sorting domain-containing protein [Bacteroidales bacterium]|nr:T9SS type A sorting domain-containing protein [Bacteroidales bacterium]
MKKLDKIIKTGLVFIALVCFSLLAKADTFHSTAAGGYWDNATTWEEGSIPTSYDDIIITGPGPVEALPWPAVACNDLTINNGALLQNYTYAEITLTVNGDVINNGTITNSVYDHFYLKIYGDIVNNGVWTNYSTEMVGTNTHQISQGGSGEFTGERFEAVATTGTIYVMSDFNFNGTSILLNGVTMELDNSKGANLSILGNSMSDGELKCNGQDLYMNNGAYLWNMTIENATLKGIVGVYDYGDTFNGNTIVEDTLQSLHYLCYLTVNGTLTNNGVIRNSNYHPLHMNIYGDIINNGEWVNETINMAGTSNQYISLSAGQEFGCSNFVGTDNNTTVEALTDLTFNGTQIDFNNGRLIMPIGGGGILTIHGGSLRETDLITNSGTLFMDNGASLQDQSVIHNATLKGLVGIYDNGVVFNGNTIVEDTLQSLLYIGNLTVNDTLTNNGVIRNSNYHPLNMNIYGDIINNGEWTNNRTTLNGNEDQHIYLMSNTPIEGNVQFDAVLATTPFQWYHEGIILDSPDFNGETSQILSWNVPVQSSWYGTYYCETGEGNSRNIIVGQSLFPAANLQVTVNCTNVELSWEMQNGSPDSWNVYRDEEVIATVIDLFYTDEMLTPEIDYSYYVTANYGGEESEPTTTEIVLVNTPENIIPEDFTATPVDIIVNCTWSEPSGCLTPDGYNIYRDDEKINTSLIMGLLYSDSPGYGNFEYYVTAVYYFGESDPSNIDNVEISGINEPDAEEFKIYPNPATDFITIESTLRINTIRVFNNIGQVVVEKKVNADNYRFNVSSFEHGIYLIRLETNEGIVNTRITVK